MKKKLLLASLATSLAATIGVPMAVRAAVGPTCTVATAGADYTTIQPAVDDVNCATVKVAAGPRTENVTITRAVKLKGAKAGDNVSGRTFASAAESTVTGLLTINSADVTVDGFSLTNPTQGLGVLVKTAGNNASIKNNIVDTVGGVGFVPNAVGIYLERGPDNVKIEKNKIGHIQSAPSAQGILVGDSKSSNPSLGIRITGNDIGNITSTTRGAYGMNINNGSSDDPLDNPAATGYVTLKIRDNKIHDLNGTGWVHAIGLETGTPNVVVTGNRVSNLVSPSPDKVAVFFEDNPFFFTGDVSRNNLDVGPAAVGIAVHPALTLLYPTLNVDGTCNWWGNRNGPGAVATGNGSLVSTGVDYSPWLKSSNLNGRCGEKDHHDNDNHHWDHDNDHDD